MSQACCLFITIGEQVAATTESDHIWAQLYPTEEQLHLCSQYVTTLKLLNESSSPLIFE
jgi:hypothetical protein